MRFRLAGPLCALLVSFPLAAGTMRGAPGAWYRYPLPGAEVKSLAADPSLPGVFWAGTAQGGIYRSSDGGVSWTSPLGGAPFPGYAVTALAVDPARPGAVWAGLTGVMKGGLLARSTDLGRTFEVVRRWEDRAGARVVAVMSRSGRHAVGVGGDRGLEISEDGGETWRASAPPLDPGSGVSFMAFDPVRPGVLYCGSFRHPFRSLDGGPHLGAHRERDGRGHRGLRDRLFAGRPERVLGGNVRLGVPHDGRRRELDALSRGAHGPAHARRPRGPARPEPDPRGHDRRSVREPRPGQELPAHLSDVVVTALVFDPRDPSRLLVGTEAEGILRSEDGGLTLGESNRGLSEARVSAVAVLPSGRVVVARAADGKSGGLWSVDATTGDVERLAASPPATVLSLASAGAALVAGAPDGIYRAARVGAPFTKVLDAGTRAFASDGGGRLLAATNEGVFESMNGGSAWRRLGGLKSRVEDVRRARLPESGLKTWSADAEGLTLWWDGTEWARRPLPGGGRILTGGFGRPRAPVHFVPEPIGVALSTERAVLFFRPEEDADGGIAMTMPETGLVVAGWAGDPRSASGLYLATIGRGLFRFVPNGL